MAKEYIIGNVMGPMGEQGPQGVSVTNVEINEDGHLIVTLSNGNIIDAGDAAGPVGAEGPAGKSAYESAVEGGYTGTEEEFAEFLASGQKLPENIVSFEAYEGPPDPPLPKDADLLDGYPASYYAKAVDIVVDYTHAKTGTLHSLTGPEGAGKISWTMTATAEDGDTWEINGRPAAVLYNDGLPIMPHSLIAGDMLWAQVSTGKVVLTIPMPGSNPNLLINSDFRDPINQRGQTEYQVRGYTIDMWRTWFDNMHVSLLEDGVLLDYTGTDSDGIYQYFENGQNLLVDKTVTISALTKEYGLITKSGVLTSEASRIMQTTGFGDITLYHSTTKIQPFFFRILVNTGKSVTIIAAKLELGPRQTLAHKDAEGNWVLNDPPPDKQQELAKCQRYQIELFDQSRTDQSYLAQVKSTSETRAYGVLPLPVTMRENGTPVVHTDCSNETPYFAFGITSNGNNVNIPITNISIYTTMNNGVVLGATGSGFVPGNDYQIYVRNTNTHHFLLDRNL